MKISVSVQYFLYIADYQVIYRIVIVFGFSICAESVPPCLGTVCCPIWKKDVHFTLREIASCTSSGINFGSLFSFAITFISEYFDDFTMLECLPILLCQGLAHF